MTTKHIDQGIPTEWRAVEHSDQTFVVRLIPESSVEAFVVVGSSRNVRVLARDDAALYNGTVVEPYLEDGSRIVQFCHEYAATIARHTLREWLDEPAVRLERLPRADLEEVL